jgi:hypothetical protein
MHRSLALILIVIATCMAACQPTASSSPSASAEESATASDGAAPSESAAASEPVATAEPIPSEDLGEFTCGLPIVEAATMAQVANISDVRIGEHDGYDRVVFEFIEGTPELTLDRAEPPFAQDGSGFQIDVEGNSFLRLTMRGGSKQMDDGTSSYDGPTDFDPDFPMLVDLVEGGDFERQSTWYLGLNSEACVRLMLLTDPDRIVIDVEH